MSTSVYQRKDERWAATVGDNGRRRTVYAKSEREARRKAQSLERQVVQSGTLPDPGRRTVNDLLDLWLETARHDLRPGTLADYADVCRRHVRPTLGHVKLARLQSTHLQRLYNDLQGRGLRRIPRLVHALLHRALRLGALWGYLAFNPADRVVVPSHRPERKAVWSEEELRRFLVGARDQRHFSLWLVAIGSGCRIGELIALRWADVDWRVGTITIRRSVRQVRGEWVESKPKTRAGERTISLPREGMEALHQQRQHQLSTRLQAGPLWHERGLVFSDDSGNPLSRSSLEHSLYRLCARVGVPRVSPHGLRHLHTSLLLAGGLSLPAVAARLGHSSPAITLQVYAHHLKGQDAEAADVVGRALSVDLYRTGGNT